MGPMQLRSGKSRPDQHVETCMATSIALTSLLEMLAGGEGACSKKGRRHSPRTDGRPHRTLSNRDLLHVLTHMSEGHES
jgi:hypothetical protein